MATPKKILCATDLSDGADEAIRIADARAKAVGADLAVLHVIPNLVRHDPLFPHANVEFNQALTSLLERASEATTERVETLTGRGPGDFETMVMDGNPYADVVQTAESWGADLVVVGALGGTGLQRLLLGSVAVRVVRFAHCPVLVVRPSPSSNRVLAATDFSDSSLPAVTAAADEARLFGMELTVMHSLEHGELQIPPVAGVAPSLFAEARGELVRLAKERLAEVLGRCGAKAETHVEVGSAASAIAHVAEHLDAELVVVGTRGRSGLRRVVLGSVAETVVLRAPCSVLVVRHAAGPA